MTSKYFKIKLFVLFLSLVNVLTLKAQTNAITINIQSINIDKGHVLIALFNSQAGFPEDASKAFKTAKIKATKGSRSVVLSDIPAGNYAIALFHDVNDDGKMNKNMLGIPKESYGVSNNVKNLMSAPTYKEAMFAHKNDTELNIELH